MKRIILYRMKDPQPEGHMASYLGRRKFLATLGGAAATWPLAARAQQSGGMRRIGVLMGAVESDPVRQSELAAFRGALAKLGWREGSNLGIEVRWGGDPELCARYAAELGRFVLRPRR